MFDSGLGGLTVARAIRRLLPGARIFYVGDSANLPYGDKPHEAIREYSREITRFLVREFDVHALVIACNTATAVAADLVRASVALPVVAVEPGIKPAVERSESGAVLVLLTGASAGSTRLKHLAERFRADARVFLRPCPGLADAIEAGDAGRLDTLLHEFLRPLAEHEIDTIALGCTHYPLIVERISSVAREIAGREIRIVDTSDAVARRLASILPVAFPTSDSRLPTPSSKSGTVESLRLFCTGDTDVFARGAARFLDLPGLPDVVAIHWQNGELIFNGTR